VKYAAKIIKSRGKNNSIEKNFFVRQKKFGEFFPGSKFFVSLRRKTYTKW
jgi:hypothetical protein